MDFDLLEFCLNHKILPLCLSAHTSHVLQPLDVSIFSPISTYYAQEVNKLHIPVDKDIFPNLLARAHVKAFTPANIRAGFRATGIYPFNPHIILDTLNLPEPSLLPKTLHLLLNHPSNHQPTLFPFNRKPLGPLEQSITCMSKGYQQSLLIAQRQSSCKLC